MSKKKIVNIAVFASGFGSNFEAIVRAVREGKIKNSRIALLITDIKDAYVRQRAKRLGVKEIFISPASYPSKEKYERALYTILKREKINLIVLAGFMRVVSPYLISKFKNRIINIHPSLLPAFSGKEAIARAYKYGVKVTGVTVHIVDEKVDRGPIIVQEALSIDPNWSLKRLEKEIHKVEHRLFPQVINYFVSGGVKVKGRKVKIV